MGVSIKSTLLFAMLVDERQPYHYNVGMTTTRPRSEKMTVKDPTTVHRYCEQHSQLLAMLKNIEEFVATMPAPDENENIPGVDYGYTGEVGRLHAILKEASDLTYEMSE